MNSFTAALLVAAIVNICLNGQFLAQLRIYYQILGNFDPIFVHVLIFIFSILDVSHTAVMAYVSWHAYSRSLQSRTFIWLYSTIRLWNIPISIAAYGFYAFQIHRVTRSRAIPAAIICLLCAQTGGAIVCTISTLIATTPVDVMPKNSVAMAGTLLSTIGALLCSSCIMASMILFLRSHPAWELPARRNMLVGLQKISMRIHVPLIVVTIVDLVGYVLFPRSHVSTVMAIIIGKVWSNTLLHGLNSRGALRGRISAPPMATPVDHGIEFASQRRRRNSVIRDRDFSMELLEVGGSAGESGACDVSLEQDISSVRVSEDGKGFGVDRTHHASNVRFSEHQKTGRGREGHERRSSAPL